MKLSYLLADLRDRRVILSIDSTFRLRIEGPKGSLDEPLKRLLMDHRDALLQFIYELEERAAIHEYDSNMTSADAEALARDEVFPDDTAPDGEEWLIKYADTHPVIKRLRELKIIGAIIDVRRSPDSRKEVA